MRIIEQFLLQIIFIQLNVDPARSTWPPSDSSSIQLLGLFPDAANASSSATTSLSVHTRAMFQAAVVLARRYNITAGQQRIGWQTTLTGGNIITALSSACRGLSTSNIVGIVGPGLSREASIIGTFAKTVGMPVTSYSATDPALSDKTNYPTFHRTVPSDSTIALAMAELFVKFNWKSCIIIYQNDAFGTGGANAIGDAFDKYDLEVLDTVVFDVATQSLRGNLKDILFSRSTRLVLVWVEPTYTSLIVQTALDNDVLGPLFLWIFSSSISLSSFNQTAQQKLIGMLAVLPAVGNLVDAPINTTLLNAAYDTWQAYEPETFPGATKVDSYGLLAFDATWTLIRSIEEYCSSMTNVSSSCLPVVNSTFCFDSRFLNSDSLLKTINGMEFLGVSGPIRYSTNVTDRINGTYFVAENIQPSSNGIDYVPVLKWTDFTEWKTYQKTTIILWPGNVLTPPSGFPTLNGIKLRIGVIKSPPFLMTRDVIDGSGQTRTQLVGFIPDLIDRLQTLTGFIPEIHLAPSDQTYGGMVQAVANNVYDIVIGDVTVTSARRELVDFSTPIYDNTFSLVVRDTASVELDFFSYLKPFSRNVWLTLLGACIYSSVLVWLLERRSNEVLRDRSIFSSYAMSIWYAICAILGCGSVFAVHTAAGRLLTLALYILSIIIVATYTANLASDLTLLKTKNIISGVEDLRNGKIPFSRIGILVNSSFEDYFVGQISFGSTNFYPLKTQDEIYTSLLNNQIDVSIMDTGLLQYATNTLYCDLTLVGVPFNPNSYAMVIPKQWLYTQVMDINILLLKELGFLEDLRKKWFQADTCSDSSSSADSNAISIASLSGLFLTFLVITLLAVLLFAWTNRVVIKKHLSKFINQKDVMNESNNVNATVSTINPSESSQDV